MKSVFSGDFTEHFEFKLKSRWVIRFPEELKIPLYTLSETSRPSFIVKGSKNKPQPIKIILNDGVGPSNAQTIYGLMDANRFKSNFISNIKKFFGYKEPKVFDESLLKFKEGFDYTLELLDPTGVVVERWLMKKCTIISIDFGSLKYYKKSEQVELAKIEIIVQPTEVRLLF